MTFYNDLLCETEPIIAGRITEADLRSAARLGFFIRDAGFEIRPAMPDLNGGIDKNPLDGVEEATRVFGDLSCIDCGDYWGLGWNDNLTFDEAFSAYYHAVSRVSPGTLVGHWEWLTGPEGDSDSPRFERIEFASLQDLLHHDSRHNQVLLVRCAGAG